jgi:signal transduction histidine kinase
MQQLIEDLLIYSRTSASEKHFVKSNLNTLLAQVKEDLKEKILASGGIIESTALPDLYIIPFQFKQLLTNLISNSIKFSRPNVPPKISIESNVINSSEIKKLKQVWDEKYFHLTITDNGVGFESEYNDLVFGLFQRLHGMHKYEGTGIGLAICKKIVENHEGIITAEGNPDKGAVFNIYLPVSIVRPEWPSGSRSGTTS